MVVSVDAAMAPATCWAPITAAFTLDVYGHISEKMKDDSAARMEAYINSVTTKQA